MANDKEKQGKRKSQGWVGIYLKKRAPSPFPSTLPILFSGVAFRISNKVRAPFEGMNNKKLYEWPEYHRIIDRVTLSKIYCLLCGAGAISIWIFCKQLPSIIISSIFLLSTVVSGTVAFFMFEASQKLREILELHSE